MLETSTFSVPRAVIASHLGSGATDSGVLDTLLGKLAGRSATIGVIGLGYVGLPLARAFIEAGYGVLGFDVDTVKTERIARGESYIRHIPSEWVREVVEGGRLHATADFRRLTEADVVLICVPTPLTETREPDLSYVVSTAEAVAKVLRPGQLVVLESTTYPTTTRDVVLPILSRSGLAPGKDFFLAYSPEREDPGNPAFTASNIPKVVGAVNESSQKAAVACYTDVMADVVPVSSCEVAEACKILENTYRAVNIALVNELKVLYDQMGIDVWEVIEAAKSKPFGFNAFYPGPGLGGHCIPIDPFYLSWVARKHGLSTRFIELAGEVNSSMPEYVVKRVGEALNARGKPIRGSRVGVLGVAYKRDVDDPRESPAFRLIERLLRLGAEVSYNDPFVPSLPKMRHYDLPAMESQPLSEEYLRGLDCALIVTDHSPYDYDFIVECASLTIDTRNATRGVAQRSGRVVAA
ncbi:nucleotide sugar dehydrogenase [Botrimarina sp.]|uniref:nucleotide sugar dehydrogenase n=1 Tax=Botrimarina sp. TaxID=2795802 RepID=UPI0032EEACFB